MAGSRSSIQFCILGSVEVVANGAPLAVGTQMERALLADLVMHAPDVVSLDRLADDLWDGEPPARARQTLRVYVSHLRRALREAGVDGMLETKSPGYRLNAPADSIDAHRFEQLAAEGRTSLANGDVRAAAAALAEALACWRGEALADMADRGFARAAATRLNEARLLAFEARIEADLAMGRHAEVIGELTELTSTHPLREGLWALRIRALYKAGRQAEALSAYRELRTRLADELGIDPSPDLQRLEQAVLAQEAGLSAAPTAAPTLPSGVVTFLMTDIEGSTAHWETDASAMSRAMTRHDEIVIEHVEASGGAVIGARGEGDSRFCVFAAARDAITAAIDIQRALHAEEWGTSTPVKVRVAIYTGEAELRNADYYGTGPNRGARLRDLGHGGQILVGQTTVDLARSNLPAAVGLLHMGSFRLKDLRDPERVYQLTHPDLPQLFPALRAPEAQGNLPALLTRLIGRDRERQIVGEMLGEHRLVTLTGAAGSGKTRLAIEVARATRSAYLDGAWFIDLAPLQDAADVAGAVLRALDAPKDERTPPADLLRSFLTTKEALLVVDNCEHVIAGCREIVSMILGTCDRVRICTTSRELLMLEGERVYRIPSLSVPAEDATLDDAAVSEAVALFCDRAGASDAGFAMDDGNLSAIISICRRLDGLPLAIELAAARVSVFEPETIAARLDDHFAVLARSHTDAGDARHQTMVNAIAWSYELLTEAQRTLFRRLSIFVDGFTFETAEQLCADESLSPGAVADVIGELLARSLIEKHRTRPGRFMMLELVRGFALQQLDEAGEGPVMTTRHLEMIASMAIGSTAALRTIDRIRQTVERLDVVSADIETAIVNGLERAPDTALDVLLRLEIYFLIRSRHAFVVEALRRVIAALPADDHRGRMLAHEMIAETDLRSGAPGQGIADAEEALGIARSNGLHRDEGRLLAVLAAGLTQTDWVRAEEMARDSLAITTAHDDGEGMELANRTLGRVMVLGGMAGDGLAFYREALRLATESGDPLGILGSHFGIGMTSDDPEEARKHHEDALDIARRIGDPARTAIALLNLGKFLDMTQADREETKRYYTEALTMARETGPQDLVGLALTNLAAIACIEGDHDTAEALSDEGLAVQRRMAGPHYLLVALDGTARLAKVRGDTTTALRRFEESLSLAEKIGHESYLISALDGLAWCALDEGRWTDARSFLGRGLDLAREASTHDRLQGLLAGCARLAERDAPRTTTVTLAAAAFDPAVDVHSGMSHAAPEFTALAERLRDGSTGSETAWEQGRALSAEDAIVLALGTI